MQIWHSRVASANKVVDRRHSLSISSLLNDVSIDPKPQQQPQQFFQPDYFQYYPHHDSPLSSNASSPNSINESDLWNHSRTGMHKTNTGQIIVSSLAKAKRKRILPHQYKRLMAIFENTDTPSSEIRSQLAEELDMTKREVQVWFQNRRAKANRNKLTQDKKTSSSSLEERRRYSHPYHRSTIYSNNYQMVLESPYQPPSTTPPLSPPHHAIDILASAAEMMRK